MNPIVFLWAHPRSMSTALERVMRERGDFECLHEPFLHYYYLEKSSRRLPQFDARPGYPKTYAGTRDWILERAEHGPVFAKDMSYYVMPELLDDVEFCRRIRHCFLIRNPRRAILSYYRLDPGVSRDEIGIEAQWRQFEGLRALGIETCAVLEAEAVQSDAPAAVGLLWRELGLDFRAGAFAWDRDRVPRDWENFEDWHGRVSASAGIEPLRGDDSEGEFERLVQEVPRLKAFLEHHEPCYERLRQYSLERGGRDGSA